MPTGIVRNEIYFVFQKKNILSLNEQRFLMQTVIIPQPFFLLKHFSALADKCRLAPHTEVPWCFSARFNWFAVWEQTAVLVNETLVWKWLATVNTSVCCLTGSSVFFEYIYVESAGDKKEPWTSTCEQKVSLTLALLK